MLAVEALRASALTHAYRPVFWQVNGNETLVSVAARFDTTVTELKKLNRLMTPDNWPRRVDPSYSLKVYTFH